MSASPGTKLGTCIKAATFGEFAAANGGFGGIETVVIWTTQVKKYGVSRQIQWFSPGIVVNMKNM